MTASPAPAPILRALPTLDALPTGAIAQPVADTPPRRPAPGEFAVVDTTDREPIHGELYVIRYSSPLTDSGFRDRVIEACRRPTAARKRRTAGAGGALSYIRPRSGPELEAWADAGGPSA